MTEGEIFFGPVSRAVYNNQGGFMRAGAICSALIIAFWTTAVGAQANYPDRPVQVLVGWSPGAVVDLMVRAITEEMSKTLASRFVVINREGGAGTIAFAAVANAAPDGYTLGAGPAQSINVAGHMLKNKPFSIDSLEYVCQTFLNDFTIAVRQETPYRSIMDLVGALRTQPGKLSYGHLGPASIPHLAMVELLQNVGAEAIGVPFRGDAQVIPALMSGTVDIGVSSLLSIAPHIGKVRVLAVFGDQRNPAYPDLPSLTEQGIQISPNRGRNGIFAPKGTPAATLKSLRDACASAVRSDSVQAMARQMKSGADFLDSADFRQAVYDDYRRVGELITRLNLQAN